MAKGLITFDQYVQEKGFDNKTVNRFWKYCNQDIPNKETGDVEWWGSEATNHNDMRGYSEEFDELFEEFKNINSSRRITSAKSEEEFEDIITQIEDILGVNVEHSNIFNLNSEIDEDTEYKIDDICRQYNCKFVPVNGSRRQYRLIQSSRRNNMIKSNWKQFIKGLDKLEKRDELKDMYNSAHWEFLDCIMPCDPEWTSDMADSDFNPLDEIYFLFKSPSDIEEFLFECAKENLPGAKEKLRRIRQINTCNRVYSSRQVKSSTVPRTTKELADWMREHTGWNVNYDEKNDVFVSGPEDAQTYIDRKGRVITDGPSGVENHTIEEFMNIMDEKPIKSALDTVKVTFDNGDTIVTDYNADVGREEIAKYYMHNYFNVGGEDEMHQVVKVEFSGNINSARTPEVADMQDAEDLALFAENDHELYDMVIKPTFDSLQRKLKRGIYDKDKALIAWEHVIDEAAKAYDRQLGSKRGTMTMFNKATRKEAAKILMDSIWDEDEWQA